MTLRKKSGPVHTGEERYELTLHFDTEDMPTIWKMTAEGKPVPDTVVLVWTRRVGESWQRFTRGMHGSRVAGNVKISGARGAVGPRRSREIYGGTLNTILPWTNYLPGLRTAVEEAELALP